MAEMNVYSLVALVYDSVLYPVESAAVAPGNEVMLNGGNASIYPQIAALRGQAPMVSVSSPALKTLYDKFGQRFLIETGKTVALYYAKRTTGGIFASGSGNVILTINEGAIIFRGVSARGNADALIRYDIVATYDGTNLPYAYSTGALPTDAILAEKYCLGGANIGSLIETTSIDYDSGQGLYTNQPSGQPYPTIAAVRTGEPTVRIGCMDLAQINTVTTIGKEISSAKIFFRKFDPTTARVLDAAETNISVTFSKAFAMIGDISGGWRSESEMGIVLHPRYDGTNEPAVWDTTSAIA